MPSSSAVVRVARSALIAAALGACGDSITLEIASDRPIPSGLDTICVGVAERDARADGFGQQYRLEGALATLPQTLRVESGSADAAMAWVRGDHAGVPVARASTAIDFAGDARVALARCAKGSAASPVAMGPAAGPGGARLVASQGAGGSVVVAIVDGAATVLAARDGALVASAGPVPPAGPIVALVAADLDGDCDDDIIVATANAAPALWRRDGARFTEVGALGTVAVAALAAADVDNDLDVDLVTGGSGTLALWRNDASGTFAVVPEALGGAGKVTAVSALALGDLDGDGHPDLVVGQRRAPLQAWLGEPDGTGSFFYAPAVVPGVPLDARAVTLADADGDLDPDLVVAVGDGPARLYIDRDGRLEDQTFVRVPMQPRASAVALGGWDPGCEVDALFADADGTAVLRGQDGGVFAAEAALPGATDVVLVDLDGDGDLDAVLATAEGVQWLAR